MKYIKKTQLGFSLIEMSLVVTVLSVVIAYMLTTKNEEIKLQARQFKADKTIEEINTIGKAAGEYFLNHKQIWPAQLLISNGTSSASGVDGAQIIGSSKIFCKKNGVLSDRYNVSAIDELIKPVKKLLPPVPTDPLIPDPDAPYISVIDETSPYKGTYKTYCDDTNFFISTWVNDRNIADLSTGSDVASNLINDLQAQYVAHQGPAQSETCTDFNAPTSAFPAAAKTYLCPPLATAPNKNKQTVVTTFNRPEGWFSLSQFLKKGGDSMGGDIRLLKAGETLDGITGAVAGIFYDHDNDSTTPDVAHPGGSDIILHNGERLQEKLLNRSVILLETTYVAATATTPQTLRHDKKLIDKPICTGSVVPILDVIPISPVVYQDTLIKILESEPALHVSPKQTSVTRAGIDEWKLKSHFTNSLGDERPGSSVYLIFTSCSN